MRETPNDAASRDMAGSPPTSRPPTRLSRRGGDAPTRAHELTRIAIARAAADVTAPHQRWRAVAAAVFGTTPEAVEATVTDRVQGMLEDLRDQGQAFELPFVEPPPERLPSHPGWWTSPTYFGFLLDGLRRPDVLAGALERLPAAFRAALAADRNLVAGLLDGANPPALRLAAQTALVPMMPPPPHQAPGTPVAPVASVAPPVVAPRPARRGLPRPRRAAPRRPTPPPPMPMTPHEPPALAPTTASPTSPAGDPDRTAWFGAFLATSTDEARQLQWFPAPATLDPKAAAERAAGQAADRACETVRLALIAAARDVDGPGAFWREVAGAILDAPPDAVGHRLAEQLRLTVRAGNAAAQQRYGHRRAVVPDPGDPTDPAWWRTEAAQKVLFARLWRGDALAGPLTRLAEPYRRALAADPELVLVLLSAAQPAPLRLAVHTALVPVMAAAPVAAASARPSPRRRGR